MSGIENRISIYIPTYNRRGRLANLLRTIGKEDCDFLYEVIVSDNCSDYDVASFIKEEFPCSFAAKIRLIVNPFNIGPSGNIRNCFYWCKTKWLWMIGDDDEVLPGCFDIISKDTTENPDCAQFRYSTDNGKKGLNEDDETLRSIADLLKYYKNTKHTKGNFAFMSNNVFNLDKLSPYIVYAFMYSTSLTQCMPMIMGLDAGTIYVRYRSEKIIRFINPEDGVGWNRFRVMLAISTIGHIPFKSISLKEKKQLLRLCCILPLKHILSHTIKHTDKKQYDLHMVHSLYQGLYKGNVSFAEWILYRLFLIELRLSIPIISPFIK